MGNVRVGQNPKLAAVSPGAFNGLTVQGTLSLDSNPLLVDLEGGLFRGVTAHAVLIENQPRIQALPSGLFAGAADIEAVILRRLISLRQLPERLFDGMTLDSLTVDMNDYRLEKDDPDAEACLLNKLFLPDELSWKWINRFA